MLDIGQKAALVHVRVVHDLADVAHRRQRDAVPLGDREHLHLAQGRVQSAISAVGFLAILARARRDC